MAYGVAAAFLLCHSASVMALVMQLPRCVPPTRFPVSRHPPAPPIMRLGVGGRYERRLAKDEEEPKTLAARVKKAAASASDEVIDDVAATIAESALAATQSRDGWSQMTTELEQTVKKAKAFGLPLMCRWRLDDVVELAYKAKTTMVAAVDSAEASARMAYTRAVTAEKEAKLVARKLGESEELLKSTRAELEKGRKVAAQRVAAADDALEFEQDKLSKTRKELELEKKAALLNLEEATKALKARDDAEIRAIAAEARAQEYELAVKSSKAEMAEAVKAARNEMRLQAAQASADKSTQAGKLAKALMERDEALAALAEATLPKRVRVRRLFAAMFRPLTSRLPRHAEGYGFRWRRRGGVVSYRKLLPLEDRMAAWH